jgi:hypothetical protein
MKVCGFTVRSPPFDAISPTAVFPDAILGVSLFADIAPDQFGRFNRAFATLFRIAAGDTWIDSLPILGPDGGIQWKPALYIFTFIIVSVWVVLQVTLDCSDQSMHAEYLARHSAPVTLASYLLYFSLVLSAAALLAA